MKAYVGYSTSILYWLKNGFDQSDEANVVHVTRINNAAYTSRELMAMQLDLHGLHESNARGWPSRARKGNRAKKARPSGPAIHVLVPKGVDRNRTGDFERHCWDSHIPKGSFCALTKKVLVSTPGFSFLQMAGLLSTTQLILVGYWLCASYKVREDGLVLPVKPVTTKEELLKFLDDAQGCYGARKARRALAWVVGNARSPMEVGTAMLASLPVRLGGYGLGCPSINYSIDASELDRGTLDHADRKHFEVDLYWPKHKVGIEYDGVDHLDPAQIRKDKRRINCLTSNGITILVVMYDQLAEKETRATLMNQLSKLLKASLQEANEDAREALLGILFGNEFSL